MDKLNAKTDFTYCVNNECENKENCLRHQMHYNFLVCIRNYWFCHFTKDKKGGCDGIIPITETNN